MDWWEYFNNRADKRAKEWQAKCVENKREFSSPRLLYERWAVYLNRAKMSSIYNDRIYEGVSKSRILDYWHGHHNMKISDTSSIDWEVNRLARNRFSRGHRRFYIKYVTGQIGNQHTLHYRK